MAIAFAPFPIYGKCIHIPCLQTFQCFTVVSNNCC